MGDESPFELRFGAVPQSPIPFLKPRYMKIKRQDNLRPKAFPCFFCWTFGKSSPRYLCISESLVHTCNITWARSPPSVPVSAEDLCSVSVSGKGGKLNPSRDGVVEKDVHGSLDESSESTGFRSSVTASLIAPTPAAVPCGRTAPAGGRGTAAATSLRGAAMEEVSGLPVQSSAGTPGGGCYVCALCGIDRGKRA